MLKNVFEKVSLVKSSLILTVLLLPAAQATAQEQRNLQVMDLETYRAQWNELTEMYQELAVRPSSKVLVDELTDRVHRLTAEDFASMMASGVDLTTLLAATEEVQELLGNAEPPSLGTLATKSAGFPDALYSAVCGSTRSNTDAAFAAKVAVQVAKGVWSVASRACDETIVILGEGGNTSLICIAADAVLFTAEAVLEDIDFCDGSINAAEILGSYERLGHLHTDMDQIQADLSTDLRQMIEENLKNANPSQAIVSFQIPEAFGGQLEQVAVVVQESIDNMLAAGQSANFGQHFFNQAETLRSQASYKQAYLMYRRAYQEVARLP